ncbi:MAG: hypothetical protein AAF604_20080 [Acidobacteriota bacterium]
MLLQAIGPWILVVLGAVTVVTAIIGSFKKLPLGGTVVKWIFGVALLGIGTYGPAFLKDFTPFIEALNQVVAEPTVEGVVEFLDEGRKAGVTLQARQAVLIDVQNRPGTDSRELLEIYRQAAESSPEDQEILNGAGQWILAESKARELARRQIFSQFTAAPSRTGSDDLVPFLDLGDESLEVFQLDRGQLQELQLGSEHTM